MADPKDILRIGESQKIYTGIQKRVKTETEAPQKEESLFSSERLTIQGSYGLSEALKAAEQIPEVREDLVTKFQKLIETGAYHPDPERIAGKILEG
jgi:anti-sigma28 factor (negative regulator of flagellin synthesis)